MSGHRFSFITTEDSHYVFMSGHRFSFITTEDSHYVFMSDHRFSFITTEDSLMYSCLVIDEYIRLSSVVI